MSGESERVYLVTGAFGCIGAWTLRHLADQGERVVSFDVSDNRRRLDLLMTPVEQERIAFVRGEITNFGLVLDTIRERRVTHVIHLAALQVPFCKSDPVAGAQVNVVGTVNILEAARRAGLHHVAYASSIAALPAATESVPSTLYGVYKKANEGSAQIFWQDHGLSSIGLRPYTVYGVGRDQGLTSEPTTAMLAAAAGKAYRISFGGKMQFHFASDVARQFIEAASTPGSGAHVFNLGTEPVAVSEVVEIIRRIRPDSDVSNDEKRLPFAEAYDAGDLKRHLPSTSETPLAEGIRMTVERFEELLGEGKLTWTSA